MRAWNRRGPGADRRGMSATTQLALVAPMIFAFVLLALQASTWFYARSIALAAAETGARVSAGRHASLGEGLAAAEAFATGTGGRTFTSVAVAGSRSGEFTTITVTGEAARLLPLVPMTLTVSQSATLPVERLT